MENLNAEKVKRGLQCCANNDECVGEACPYYTTGCEKNMPKDALALIESQEERIEAYRQELAEVRVALAEANCDKKKLTEEAEGLKQCMEHEHASFMETFGEYGEKCDNLAEENERLQAEITHLEGHREADKKAFKTLRADTVRKMQERFNEKVAKLLISPSIQYQASAFIDQIAKELLGEMHDE